MYECWWGLLLWYGTSKTYILNIPQLNMKYRHNILFNHSAGRHGNPAQRMRHPAGLTIKPELARVLTFHITICKPILHNNQKLLIKIGGQKVDISKYINILLLIVHMDFLYCKVVLMNITINKYCWRPMNRAIYCPGTQHSHGQTEGWSNSMNLVFPTNLPGGSIIITQGPWYPVFVHDYSISNTRCFYINSSLAECHNNAKYGAIDLD